MGVLDGAVVVVPGAGGAAGGAVALRLAGEGAHVVAAGRHDDATMTVVDQVVRAGGSATGVHVDLTDEAAVRGWADEVVAAHGRVDGVVHLVGGYADAPSFAATDLAGAERLHTIVAGTVARAALAFRDGLAASPYGRFVIVSAPAAVRPTGPAAGYAAAKAAAEAWTRALADDFRRSAPDAAAAVLVIKALVTAAMREQHPDRAYDGFTSPEEVADGVVGLWTRPAAEVNGRRIPLTEAAA